MGNLNVSFMTSKARHNRKANLGLLCDVVKDALGVNLEVNSRWGKDEIKYLSTSHQR